MTVVCWITNCFFCTRKVKQAKFNKHNHVFLRFLKQYTVNVFAKELKKVNFSNYERFSYIDAVYTDFLNKLIKVVNKITPCKEIRININTQEQFDIEIAELIHARKKLFSKFKKSKLHIDEEIYKKVKYRVQNLRRKKKRRFNETNLKQKKNKSKELWKILKSICLKEKNEIVLKASFLKKI